MILPRIEMRGYEKPTVEATEEVEVFASCVPWTLGIGKPRISMRGKIISVAE